MTQTPNDWKLVTLDDDLKIVIAGDEGTWCEVQGLFDLALRSGYEVIRVSRAKAIEGSEAAKTAMNVASSFGHRAQAQWRLPATALFIHQTFWVEWLQMCGLPSSVAMHLGDGLLDAIALKLDPPPVPERLVDETLDEIALRVLQSLLVAGNIPRHYGAPNGYDHVASAYAIAAEVMRFRSGERSR